MSRRLLGIPGMAAVTREGGVDRKIRVDPRRIIDAWLQRDALLAGHGLAVTLRSRNGHLVIEANSTWVRSSVGTDNLEIDIGPLGSEDEPPPR